MIKKFVSNGGVILEIGDFYGGGQDEVIQTMEEEGTSLTVNTSCNFYTLTMKPGDYVLSEDGSAKIVKSKYDKDE